MTEDKTDERPNALLTKTDRKWLAADEPMYTGESAAQMRYRRRKSIRDRLTASMHDFVLLFEHLDEDTNWIDIFDPDNYSPDEWSGGSGFPERTTPDGDESEFDDRTELADVNPDTGQPELRPPEERLTGIYEGMVDALALFFKSFYERKNAEHPQAHADQLIEASLRRVLADRGESLYEFDFQYSTSPLDIQELTQRFYDGEELTYDEFETLRREGNIVDSEGRPIDPADTASVRFGLADFIETNDESEDTD